MARAGRGRTRADEVAADAVAEVVEDAVAVGLQHFSVDVETRVPELGDLLGEELHAVNRVAEDDGLVDLELQGGGKGMSVREVGRAWR